MNDADAPLLRVLEVRKTFGPRVVLQDFSLQVNRGECVVLIGPSRSGKSTALRCINLLDQVDDGVIELQGRDITDPRVNVNEIRAQIGMVFQSFNLFPHLNVMENLLLAPVRGRGMDRAAVLPRAREVLDRVGLADRERARPDDLSGGQQQRVAIARALVNEPTLLLLDEVTSALDPELVGEVLSLLRDLRAQGLTMILNTHEMDFAREVADQVCFLYDGVIHEQGTPDQVLVAPRRSRTRQFLGRLSH